MFFRIIYLGMIDRRIALLQQLLNEILNPSPNLEVTGKYDNSTKEALKRFERGVETMSNGKLRNAFGRPAIFPIDGKIDEAAWVAIGMALKLLDSEKFRNLVFGNPELLELFGILPETLEVNQYPVFSANDLKDVIIGLNLAKQKVKESSKKDDVLLTKYGIPSVMTLLDGVIIQGDSANTFDGRKSFLLDWEIAKKESNNLTRTLKQYFIDKKESVGAIVKFDSGPTGKNVMFIGDYFFSPFKSENIQLQRAFIIMHESVHLVGNKTDNDFGGSRNLSKLLVETFMPILKNKLGGVA
jgi:hypothetical protein